MPSTMENFANRLNAFEKHNAIAETPKRITRASRAKIKPENILYNENEADSEDEDFNQAGDADMDGHRSSEGVQAEEDSNDEGSEESDSFDGLVEDENEEGGPIDINDYMQKRAFL